MIIDPPLLAIANRAVEMGEIAAQQVLKDREHRGVIASETVVLETELLVRESSGKRIEV